MSPVGNRVTCFDLKANVSHTLPCETQHNIRCIDTNGAMCVMVDDSGKMLLVHVQKRIILHRMSFKSSVTAIKFSPCGQFLAVALSHKHLIQIWRTPTFRRPLGSENDGDD